MGFLAKIAEFWSRLFSLPSYELSLPPPEPPPQEDPNQLGGKANRRQVNKYEKARRRYDKFLPIPRGAAVTIDAAKSIKKEKIDEPLIESSAATDEALEDIFLQKTSEGDYVAIKEAEFKGEFNFRDSILDQLDRYFVYIRRMKKYDKDAYQYYRRVGATLLPYASYSLDRLDKEFLGTCEIDHKPIIRETILPASFREILPTYGCFAYGTDPITEAMERDRRLEKGGNKERWIPKFMYFEKMLKAGADIQPVGGLCAVYRVTIYWDRPYDILVAKKMKGGAPQQYMVGVRMNGELIALKLHKPERVIIRGRRGISDFHRPGWYYPDYVSRAAGETPAYMLRRIFCDIAQYHTWNSAIGIRVSVKHENLVATFGINPERIAYFFADRDLIVDEQGRKVRIFHVVKPHDRIAKNGERFQVKQHYRGIRRFKWAGYEVLITVPGMHHVDISSFNVPGVDKEDLPPGAKGLSQGQVGKVFARVIEGKKVKLSS